MELCKYCGCEDRFLRIDFKTNTGYLECGDCKFMVGFEFDTEYYDSEIEADLMFIANEAWNKEMKSYA